MPVPCPLHETLGLAVRPGGARSRQSPRGHARSISILRTTPRAACSRGRMSKRLPHLCRERNLWLISDEAYEDVLFDGAEHVSAASLPGHVRAHDLALHVQQVVRDDRPAPRIRRGARRAASRADEEGAVLHGQQRVVSGAVRRHRRARRIAGPTSPRSGEELEARRDLFYAGIKAHAAGVFSGAPPRGAFYAFLANRIRRGVPSGRPHRGSLSWAMAEFLISRGRIGCVPGVDFGANGEGYIRFCFARDRAELTGALESMRTICCHENTDDTTSRTGDCSVASARDGRRRPGWFRR